MSYQQAIHLVQKGELQQAKILLSALPLEFHTANLLGVVGQLLQDWSGAYSAWVQASTLQPNNLDVRLNLGVACMALGQKEEAAFWWGSILELECNHPQSLINLGLFHRERQENQQAHHYWERALDLLPGNANVREWLADVKGVLGSGLLSLGRMVEAEPLLKEAVELDPTYSILWGYLSRWHFQQHEYEVALETCNRAIQLEQDNNEFFRMRGDIQRALKDEMGALESYQYAIQLGDNEVLTQRAIAELSNQCLTEDIPQTR